MHTYAGMWGSVQCTVLPVSVCPVLLQAEEVSILQQCRRVTPISQPVKRHLGVLSASVALAAIGLVF